MGASRDWHGHLHNFTVFSQTLSVCLLSVNKNKEERIWALILTVSTTTFLGVGEAYSTLGTRVILFIFFFAPARRTDRRLRTH